VALVLGLSLVAGCGSADGSGADATGTATAAATAAQPGAGLDVVSATGPVDLKTAPEVTLGSTPVSTAEVEHKVLTPGTGKEATKADTVSVKMRIYNGTTGEIIDDGFADDRPAEGYRLGRADLLQGFAEGLVGAQKNGRIAFTIPPAQGFGEAGNEQLGIGAKDTIVVVADVADVTTPRTQVDGEQKDAPAGLPTVAFPDGPTKAPTVTVPKADAPAETTSAVLVEGDGPVVEKGDTITAQYHGVLWKDGKTFDSSWERGSAADFPIGVGQVIPGWDSELVGKKVGSRVLLVVPPKDGYGEQGSPQGGITGTDTLVFVVDILDAY
jgi:FKBP-type peptidyl-prolyl cis-trans isomerase